MKGLTLTFLYDVPNYEPCKISGSLNVLTQREKNNLK
jgi:hypothetical protein